MEASTSSFIDITVAADINFRDLTLQDAIDILETEETDEVECIFIEPPEATVNSDEDSADEDEGGLIDNLSDRQLRSGAQISFTKKHLTDDPYDPDNIQEPGVSKKAKKPKIKHYTWRKKDIKEFASIFPEPNYTNYRNLTPVQIFERIFDDEIIDHIRTETTKYAIFKNLKDPRVSREEIKIFVAILYLSGYNTVPSNQSYWESSQDMRNELVVNAMRRDRFLEICRLIHFADSTKINENDKMWKLRPLMDLLRNRFITMFEPEEHLDFDECMVAYFGRHNCKQFIRGKPIRFGYKVWCLNAQNGFLVDFDVYQGKNPNRVDDYEVKFGKAASPLLQMLDRLPDNIRSLPFKIYFNNLFSTISLFVHLKELGYGGTGTFRENMIPNDCPINSSKDLKKRKRGFYEQQTSEEDKITIVKWMDSSVVTIGSTCHGVQPISKVTRYCRIEKRKISVTQPAVITNYNKYMGGTDRMDENILYYRIGIRGKKWYWSLFTWMLDIMMQNAWLLMRKTGNNISQIEFRRAIVSNYLQTYTNIPSGSDRPSVSKFSNVSTRVSDDIRLDGIGHLVAPCSRRRCAAPECSSTVRTHCIKCDVGLCIGCFVNFHTE